METSKLVHLLDATQSTNSLPSVTENLIISGRNKFEYQNRLKYEADQVRFQFTRVKTGIKPPPIVISTKPDPLPDDRIYKNLCFKGNPAPSARYRDKKHR